MATPLGHALAGIGVGLALRGERPLWGRWRDVGLLVIMAWAPDFDFLPGLAIGRPEAFHHGASHSIGFAVLFGLVLAAAAGYIKGAPAAWRWGMVGCGVYLVQVLLDAVTDDTSLPRGVPLLWPLSWEYFISDPVIFLDVRRNLGDPSTIVHNFWAALREVIILAPLALGALWWRLRPGRQPAR